MRKLLINLVFLGGVSVAAGAWSQEPREQRENPAALNQRMAAQESRQSLRQESLRTPPPTIHQPRPDAFNERAAPRESLFNERARNPLRAQQGLRDPRVVDYRSRVWSDEPIDRSVPRDMQRAIEQAQAEHGGKVLSADRIRYRGQDTYRVKLLTPSGRVRVVQMSEAPARAENQPPTALPDEQTKGDQ